MTSTLTAPAASTTTATVTEPVLWEVVWGEDEQDRVLYTDFFDGTSASNNAEIAASVALLKMTIAGVPAGLYRNGAHVAGVDLFQN